MASLVLDESQVMFDIVQAGQVRVPEYMRVKCSDSSLSPKFADLLVDRAVDNTLTT